MQVTAQQVFKELESGVSRLLYLILGDEPFQAQEIEARIKKNLLRDETDDFTFEVWDAEHLDAAALLTSLQTLPGLFALEATSPKVVVCRRFEKASSAETAILEDYFRSPSETSCLVLFCAKADKRKAWFKLVDEKGYIIEVAEPHAREWPKWQAYLEKKIEKQIQADAWEMLVELSNRKLSMLWSELQKMATFVGDSGKITRRDLLLAGVSNSEVDIFELVEDVVSRRAFLALRKYHALVQNGESDIKILSLLVRQFRLIQQCLQLTKQGVSDPKIIGAQVGTNPYFVPKILQQAKKHTLSTLPKVFHQLSECDFLLKTGDGGLFEHFLVPYFEGKRCLSTFHTGSRCEK